MLHLTLADLVIRDSRWTRLRVQGSMKMLLATASRFLSTEPNLVIFLPFFQSTTTLCRSITDSRQVTKFCSRIAHKKSPDFFSGSGACSTKNSFLHRRPSMMRSPSAPLCKSQSSLSQAIKDSCEPLAKYFKKNLLEGLKHAARLDHQTC